MKICNVSDCEEQAYVKGSCRRHYIAIKQGRYGCLQEGCLAFISFDNYCAEHKKCTVEGCDSANYYAKGYCRNHYSYHNRTPEYRNNLPAKKCKATQCTKEVKRVDYCKYHQKMFREGRDPNKDYRVVLPGKDNLNWNGGISQYPNHTEMKRVRKQILKDVDYICQDCGGEARVIHHLDGSKDNHAIENFRAVCHKCHRGNYHSGMVYKVKNTYGGLTLRQISDKVGCSYQTAYLQLVKGHNSKTYAAEIRAAITVS